MSDDWVVENDLFRAWESGFNAGQQSVRNVRIANPYTWRATEPAEKPGPPEFPEFWIRADETTPIAMDRWTMHMRDFKVAWDEWSRGLR